MKTPGQYQNEIVVRSLNEEINSLKLTIFNLNHELGQMDSEIRRQVSAERERIKNIIESETEWPSDELIKLIDSL